VGVANSVLKQPIFMKMKPSQLLIRHITKLNQQATRYAIIDFP
jgi:hypothetical protein